MTAYQSILEEGKIEGKIETKIELIIKASKRGKLNLSEIAENFDVSVEFVLQIKNENGL